MLIVTLNIGTDRNGNGETNPDQTKMEAYRWANKLGGKVSHQWQLSPAIGDWPQEDVLVLRVVLPCLLPVDAVRELCDTTQQHAVAVLCNGHGRMVWSNNTPEHVQRFGFDVDYFHPFRA